MNVAGNFRELEEGSPDGPSLVEARNALDAETAAAAARDLSGGDTYISAATVVVDYFSHQPIASLGYMTDGDWVWPTSFPYYVATYRVAVPDALLERMEQRRWECPPVTEAELARVRGPTDPE